jgi:DNA helicase-2/ATP-dependent DNA helicase PcrA
MHALGLRGIKTRLPQCTIDTNGNALYSFIKEQLKSEDEDWKLLPDIRALVEKAAICGLVPNNERSLLQDIPEVWEEIADLYDIETNPVVLDLARQALIYSNEQALQGNIMFMHMLTLPLFFGFPLAQYPKIIVDEAQDLNILQHMLVAKALRHNGRIFAAGDDRQAIYAFAGARTNSFDELSTRFSATGLPLTVSWRCAQEVIREAQQWVPDIEWAPGAIEGSVVPVQHTELEDLPRIILCRNNAPLTRLAMRLFVAGHSVECAGRDIGAGLKSTMTRVAATKDSEHMPIAEFLSRLQRWAAREIERRPGRKPRVHDKVEALTALAETHTTVGAVRKHIDNLFVDQDGDKRTKQPPEFVLSTVHKAKGREWSRVGFLDAHLLPSKYATTPEQIQQEANASYVAVTRAKQELVYLDSNMIL